MFVPDVKGRRFVGQAESPGVMLLRNTNLSFRLSRALLADEHVIAVLFFSP